jgi:hypothetical protein
MRELWNYDILKLKNALLLVEYVHYLTEYAICGLLTMDTAFALCEVGTEFLGVLYEVKKKHLSGDHFRLCTHIDLRPSIRRLNHLYDFIKFSVGVLEKSCQARVIFVKKSGHWRPYCTWGRNWTSTLVFHIYWHIWVKYGISPCNIIMDLWDSLTSFLMKAVLSIRAEMKFCPYFLHFSLNFDVFRCRRSTLS